MPYCTKCGMKLPEDEEARFCPNCGAPIREVYRRTKADEIRPISGLKRLLLFFAVLLLCLIVTSAGALSNVNVTEAKTIVKDFNEMEEIIKKAGVRLIFGNNLMYCLIMFIPFIGPISGFYVLYSTGKVLAAISRTVGANPLILFMNIMIFPHAWLEYLSYSLAITESILLSIYLVKYKFRGVKAEATNVAKYIAVCSILLLLGAVIEMALISTSSSTLISK